MAKAPRNNNEGTAQLPNENPIRTLAWVLSLIGKPVYFLLSHIIIAVIFIFYITGHTISYFPSRIYSKIKSGLLVTRKSKKKPKPTLVKKHTPEFRLPEINFSKVKLPNIIFPKITPPRIRLPKIKFPNLNGLFKIEGLKISLFELKIVSNIKKRFVKKISRFQKLQTKKRITLAGIILAVLFLIFYSYFFIFRALPSPRELTQKQPQVSTKIYDRNGNLLYTIYKDQNRTIVPLTQIPVHVRLATLAAEDAEFYTNPGFSILKGIIRAIFDDIQTGSLQGGSTITQQLA